MYVKSAYISKKNNSENTDELLNVLDVRTQSPRSLRPKTLVHSDSTVVTGSIRDDNEQNAIESVNNLQTVRKNGISAIDNERVRLAEVYKRAGKAHSNDAEVDADIL